MTMLIVALEVLLALTLLLSALGKLVAPDRGRRAFVALGIPVRHPRFAAAGIIGAELLIAFGLIISSGWTLAVVAWVAAAFTFALLVVVVRAHRSGSQEDCGCFGDWLPSRIGAPLIARNVAMTVSAITLGTVSTIAASTRVPVGLAPAINAGEFADQIYWSLAACAMTAAVIGTTTRALEPSRDTSPQTRTERPGRGSGAVLLPGSGEIVDLTRPGAQPRLLVFLRPGCRACIAARDLVAVHMRALEPIVEVYLVYTPSGGNIDDLATADVPARARLAVDIAGSLGDRLDIGARRPAAALLTRTGEMAVPVAGDFDTMTVLISGLVAVAAETDGALS